MDINKFILQRIDSALDKNAKNLTKALRLRAIERSWPLSLALNLHVIYKPKQETYGVWYPDEYKEKIELYEYGDRSTPPNPVIRPFMYSAFSESDLTDEFMYQLEEDLIDAIGMLEWV